MRPTAIPTNQVGDDASDKTTVQLHDKTFVPMIAAETIAERVREMGAEIRKDCRSETPVFLSVLNGAFVFAADLIRAYGKDCECSFVRLKSYSGMQSSGKVDISLQGTDDLKDRHVIIVEDIVDSGLTLAQYKPILESSGPASVRIAALLVKPDVLQHDLSIDYVGFEIGDEFVVGYGMDYDELGRQLNGIYVVSE